VGQLKEVTIELCRIFLSTMAIIIITTGSITAIANLTHALLPNCPPEAINFITDVMLLIAAIPVIFMVARFITGNKSKPKTG